MSLELENQPPLLAWMWPVMWTWLSLPAWMWT